MRMKLSWIVRRLGFKYGMEDMQQDLEVIKLEEQEDGFLRCRSRAIDLIRKQNRYESMFDRGVDVDQIPQGDMERDIAFRQFAASLNSREKAVLKRLLNGETQTEIANHIKGSRREVVRLISIIRLKINFFLFGKEE